MKNKRFTPYHYSSFITSSNKHIIFKDTINHWRKTACIQTTYTLTTTTQPQPHTMSIFSQMKRAHKHKEQGLKPVEQSHEKPSSYKHIPTHAASDAITGSPASWDAKERSKIREENRKRSAMAAAQAHAYHMNMPSAPQGGSGSSSVAYTSGEVTPMVPPPGAISWNVPNYSNPYSDEDPYTRPSSHKGKEVDRRGACYFDSPHGSPSSNKGSFQAAQTSAWI